jgi:hypothetical protein
MMLVGGFGHRLIGAYSRRPVAYLFPYVLVGRWRIFFSPMGFSFGIHYCATPLVALVVRPSEDTPETVSVRAETICAGGRMSEFEPEVPREAIEELKKGQGGIYSPPL